MSGTIGIYKIQSISNPERFYIGSSVNIENRWRRHRLRLKLGNHHSIKLQRHFDKYGFEDIGFILLEECAADETRIIEQNYLDKLNPYFNSSKSAYGVGKGNIPWNKGTTGAQVAWNKGLKMPEDQRLQMIGKYHSEYTKEKISKSKSGIKQTQEAICKRAKSLCKKVYQFNFDKILIMEYDSVKDASRITGITYQHISTSCRGVRKSAGGFLWSYSNNK